MLANTKKSLTPKIRFSYFNEPWEEASLGNLTNIFDGTHQTPKYVNKGIPFYSVEHVTGNQFDDTKYISEEVFNQEKIKPEKNDILMTRIGDIGSSKLLDWDVRASFYVSLALIKTSDNLDSKFLNQYIATQYFQKELWQRTIHVAFPKKINLGEISKCLIKVPKHQEQDKIASFLSKVDNLISTLEKQKASLEKYKKGMMQKIFSKEVRFKDDDGNEYPDWKEKKLGDIGKVSMCKRIFKNETLATGDIPFYKIGTFGKSPDAYISSEKYEEFKQKFSYPRVGDILLSASGTIGRQVVFDGKPSYFQDSNIVWLEHDEKNILNSFLTYIYSSIIWVTDGSTINRLYNRTLLDKKVLFPTVSEQEKIASFLSSIDIIIDSKEKQIKNTKEWKKGLLQQMFV